MKRILSVAIVALAANGCGKTADSDTNNNPNNVVVGDCAATDITGEIENGAIEGDVTFCGLVVVNDDIYNSGPTTVTVRPGTVFRFGVDRYMELGWAGNEATLNAEGTAEDPIVFEGSTSEAGHWQGLRLRGSVNSDSVIDHIIVRDAGGQGEPAINNESERGLLFKNVTIENSGSTGLASASFKAGSENLSVKDSEGPAVSLLNALAVSNLPLGGTFENNSKNFVQIDFGTLDVDTTWKDATIPYRVNEDLYNTGDTLQFTVEPNVVFEFNVDRYIEFGWAGNGITFNIEGTEAEPVIFKGSEAVSAHWKGIRVRGAASTASTMSFVEIHHAGSVDAVPLSVESAIKINDVTLADNATPAVFISEEGLKDGSANLTVTNDAGPSVELEANALFSLPLGGSYGSGSAYVAITNGALRAEGEIANLDVPYRVEDSLYNADPVTITVETGTKIQFAADTYLEIGWAGNAMTFQADGVEFTGATETAGFWSGIRVKGSASTGSFIRNSTISHAQDSAISIDNDTFEFTGNTVNQTSGVCVIRANTDTTDYAGTNTLDCTGGAVSDF